VTVFAKSQREEKREKTMEKIQIANLAAYILNVFITYAGGIASIFGGKTNSEGNAPEHHIYM